MTDTPERTALAQEVVETEGLLLEQALDWAALEEASLQAYAAAWDADCGDPAIVWRICIP